MTESTLQKLERVVEQITKKRVEDIRKEDFCESHWYKASREGRIYDSGYRLLTIRK